MLQKACERTHDEGFFVITHVLVCLTCITVLHLSGLHKEKHQKTCGVLVASCKFHDLGRLAESCQLIQTHIEARHVGRPHPWNMIFGGSIYRTQQTVLDIFISLRGTAENFWFFLLTCAKAEAWPLLLGWATAAAVLTLLNWTAGVAMKCLRVGLPLLTSEPNC